MIDATAASLGAVLDVVRVAAHDAAALARRGFRAPLAVEHKGELELVTAFDRQSEDLVRARLEAAFDVPIIGEEHGGTRGDGLAFYVDPIDGTANFVHGHPFWCVSIGLVRDRTPVLGVVLAPALGIEWYGFTSADGTARAVRREAIASLDEAVSTTITESPCVPSRTAVLEDAILATGFPYDRRTSPENNLDTFARLKRTCRAIRRCGSAAIDACFVADGTYDGYWEMKLKPWDIAGGTAIIRAAGGRLTDYAGGDAFLETGRLVATNGSALHGALSAAIASREQLPR